MDVREVDATLDVALSRGKATVHYEHGRLEVFYEDVPRLSRALSIIKESAPYAAFLKDRNLA